MLFILLLLLLLLVDDLFIIIQTWNELHIIISNVLAAVLCCADGFTILYWHAGGGFKP
jgi:hypothetical protein